MNALPERPDLGGVRSDVLAYIEALEGELNRLRETGGGRSARAAEAADLQQEPPGSGVLVTLSEQGQVKRTPRHLYGRQRRGGMGVFDIDLPEGDRPVALTVADAADTLLLFTNNGRAFRLPVEALTDAPVRARGQSLSARISLPPHERVVAALPDGRGQFVALLSQRGWVRRIRASYLGKSLIQGNVFHDVKEGGPLVAACWTAGNESLFIASREGKGIRFDETQVPGRGCLGLRLDVTDTAAAIAGVSDNGGIFLATADGLGTVRLVSGFAPNKAPGAGGKVVMKTDSLVGAVTVRDGDDVVLISRLGKVVRFAAAEVPAKEGVVQGVACISLRADEAVAAGVFPAQGRADRPGGPDAAG
jgi:DNA gyrase subunit A